MADIIREREVRESPVRESDGGGSAVAWAVVVILLLLALWWVVGSGWWGDNDAEQTTDQSPSVNIEMQAPTESTGESGESGTQEAGSTEQNNDAQRQ